MRCVANRRQQQLADSTARQQRSNRHNGRRACLVSPFQINPAHPCTGHRTVNRSTTDSHAAISIVVGRWRGVDATRAAVARSGRRPASATARPRAIGAAAATAAPILAPGRHRAGGRSAPGRQWAGDDIAVRPFPRWEAPAACEAGGWDLDGVRMDARMLDLLYPTQTLGPIALHTDPSRPRSIDCYCHCHQQQGQRPRVCSLPRRAVGRPRLLLHQEPAVGVRGRN